jgi:hypothetical protein
MLAPAQAGTETVPEGTINAANIIPLAALATDRSSADTFVIRMPVVIIFDKQYNQRLLRLD